jgi:tripartite-type tricarboxylate transporter receptor subunit TctC
MELNDSGSSIRGFEDLDVELGADVDLASCLELSAGMNRMLQEPDVKERLRREAFDSEPMTPEQFTAFVKKEYELWGPIVKSAGTDRR